MRRARPSVSSATPHDRKLQTTIHTLYDACMHAIICKIVLDVAFDMTCKTEITTLTHHNYNYTLSVQNTTRDFDKTNKDVEMKILICYEIYFRITLDT